MRYQGKMDPQCTTLCDAINRIPDVYTTDSCCGHGKRAFNIFFRIKDQRTISILLYYIDPCHMGFRWDCKVYTDCSIAPARYYIESKVYGEEAYEQANKIAVEINNFMDNRFNQWWNDYYGLDKPDRILDNNS